MKGLPTTFSNSRKKRVRRSVDTTLQPRPERKISGADRGGFRFLDKRSSPTGRTADNLRKGKRQSVRASETMCCRDQGEKKAVAIWRSSEKILISERAAPLCGERSTQGTMDTVASGAWLEAKRRRSCWGPQIWACAVAGGGKRKWKGIWRCP